MMVRRLVSVGAAFLLLVLACTPADPDARVAASPASGSAGVEEAARLPVPPVGRIPVAFVISPGATVIDFSGPWEVFQDVILHDRAMAIAQPFELFTVGPSREPVRVSGGLQIVPDYTFADAPEPKIIVVPAQEGAPGLQEWLRSASAKADLTMSVCTGAFVLADAGLLNGRSATTHHDFLDRLEHFYPEIKVRRDVRYVEGRRIATAGGLTSGIDLALRVVARYFGPEVAQQTASYMEHTGTGWHKEAGVWDDAPDGPVGKP
jgi:transcriptional regulator GlxA family with amidase domain